MNSNQLEDRLISFASEIYKVSVATSKNDYARNISNQLSRSATSAALNYAESRGAQSRKDFIHKQRIALKELRESYVSLKIINMTNICAKQEKLNKSLDECNQLISIFVASIRSAEKNLANLKSDF